MKIVGRVLVSTLAVLVSAQVVPGVKVDAISTALVVAVVMGVLNTLVKPILVILTLPITILSLGLFLLVINVLIVYLTSNLVSGFEVESFLSALVFSLVMSLVGAFLHKLS
jgi:putative membrane protein